MLATRSPEDHILLAVRDVFKGEDAIARLRKLGINAKLDIVHMDVTSDESVFAAEQQVRSQHKKLDGVPIPVPPLNPYLHFITASALPY